MNFLDRTASTAKAAHIGFQVEEPQWRAANLTILRRAARHTLASCHRAGGLTVLLANDERLQGLNRQFRGTAKPTNVLSFPALTGDQGYLGDIAIAFGATQREAASAMKPLTDHAAHLVVHGVLHLLGYDHESAGEAHTMEGLEVAILEQVGVGNPYAGPITAE
ncbi:MAG TPA: rRNA maturation RNase YbeY [Rhizomicrobium sp.]